KTGAFVSLGGTLKHLNQPAYSFLTDDPAAATELKMLRQFSVRGGVPNFSNNVFGLDGAVIYAQQGTFQQLLIQPDLQFFIAKDAPRLLIRPAIRLTNRFDGTLPTHLDALVLSGGFSIERMMVQVAYDVNLSGLQVASLGRGGIEISLTYHFFKETKCEWIFCPRDFF
ncbi:MAG: hypothetical protein AB8G22_08630, partial [Saprospiraceae bacterium]